MTKKTYYDILHIQPTASGEIIKASYRAMMKKHHSDLGGEHADDAKVKQINRAYECLIDPERRAKYDTRIKDITNKYCNEKSEASKSSSPTNARADSSTNGASQKEKAMILNKIEGLQKELDEFEKLADKLHIRIQNSEQKHTLAYTFGMTLLSFFL